MLFSLPRKTLSHKTDKNINDSSPMYQQKKEISKSHLWKRWKSFNIITRCETKWNKLKWKMSGLTQFPIITNDRCQSEVEHRYGSCKNNSQFSYPFTGLGCHSCVLWWQMMRADRHHIRFTLPQLFFHPYFA